MLSCHTYTQTHCPMGVQAAPTLLPLQVKRPTQKGHMTKTLAFLPILRCISGVHETLRHPPLLSLAHARLLVAVAESRACQEPCLGATWNDKMRMRAKGWHMVLISSQVYRGSLSTEHNQTYSQHPAHWISSHTSIPPRCHRSIWKRNYIPLFQLFAPKGNTEVVCFKLGLTWLIQICVWWFSSKQVFWN